MKNSTIEQIKPANPIESVIGRYVKLTVKGNRGSALCPFHAEKTPSFMVDIRKQVFTCFGCGEKGDVIEFVKKMERCSFQEAIGKLEHTTQPTHQPPKGEGIARDTNTPSSGSRGVGRGVDHQPFLSTLMPYMAGHSELTPTYLDFEVGVAPVLSTHALRGRIIFPIRNEEGELVGLAGRISGPAQQGVPKYLNTTAESGFYRSHLLYGLHRARAKAEDTGILYLTEGYKDTIAMHAAGFTNTVGLCGTALTEGQLSLIRKYAEKVFIVMDHDAPGQAAAVKIQSRLLQAHMECVNILLPEGEDPDSWFRTLGRTAFETYIRQAGCPADRTEQLLLTACLLYPEVMLEVKGELYPFNSLLPGLLQTDDLLFRQPEHHDILAHLAEGKPWDELPEPLLQIATRLWQTWHQEVERHEKEWLLLKSGNRPEALAGLVQAFLFRYCENRIVGHINDLVRCFHRTPHTTERGDLLHRIAAWKELLTSVSLRLGRPGAIDTRWIA